MVVVVLVVVVVVVVVVVLVVVVVVVVGPMLVQFSSQIRHGWYSGLGTPHMGVA